MLNPSPEKIRTLKFAEDEVNKKKSSKTLDADTGSETEIVTEIIVPEDGRWGWVVVAGSFMCMFLLEGIFFTFGSIYKDISEDLDIDIPLVTLINSIAMALYFIAGPIGSALANRFGFRLCTMIGSIIVAFSYLISYFASNYIVVLIFYGVFSGIGGCLIYISSQLVVGFYFERLRALAMSVAGLGASCGIAILSRFNNYIVQLSGWRTVTLIHAGLFGSIYFIAMLFRPLVSLSVSHDKEDIETITYLPSLSVLPVDSNVDIETEPVTTPTEKLLRAVSNVHFPTVADVVDVGGPDTKEDHGPGPSSLPPEEKIVLKPRVPQGGATPRWLRRISMITSKKHRDSDCKEADAIHISMSQHKDHKTPKWYTRCCHWEGHVEESRPMYRDDAFYNGTLNNLTVYKEHVLKPKKKKKKTGFEYQMAVSRTIATEDLQERKGIFTMAVRRVLATMLDPQLLKRNSFFMVCTTGFLVYLGVVIPYIFLPDRNRSQGIDDVHCNAFVSVMGISNGIGRLLAGILACKFNPIRLYSLGCVMAGTGIIISNFLYSAYYQYFCCVLFGFATAIISTLRSLVLVDLYGLDNLTNATGILLMFQGFGSLIGTPLASALKNVGGFEISFYLAGSFMVMGGLIVLNVKRVAKSEQRAKAKMITGKYSSVIKRKKKSKSVVAK